MESERQRDGIETLKQLVAALQMEKLHEKIGFYFFKWREKKKLFYWLFFFCFFVSDTHVVDRVRGDLREMRLKVKEKFADVHELIRILEIAGPNSTEKELTLVLATDRTHRLEKIQKDLRLVE